ncbi:hypothetical protein HDE79_004399 [Rhodanobacter sp. MP1X3]|nr:hypothetical protein [Rhodanobacter sp. MP1X3]
MERTDLRRYSRGIKLYLCRSAPVAESRGLDQCTYGGDVDFDLLVATVAGHHEHDVPTNEIGLLDVRP